MPNSPQPQPDEPPWYGPVCPVVWEGLAEGFPRRPYPDVPFFRRERGEGFSAARGASGGRDDTWSNLCYLLHMQDAQNAARANFMKLASSPFRFALVIGLGAALAAGLVSCKTSELAKRETSEDTPPEHASGYVEKPLVTAKKHMVVAAHPAAATAGEKVLAQGGSAIDAAIAIQATLTLVEPQSSGIGGGAFLLYWSAKEKKLYAYDGRETAPAAATASLFLDDTGAPLGFFDAVVGGRSVGTPGVLKMLEVAHQAHGTLEWGKTFAGAIAQATNGFEVSPRLHMMLDLDRKLLANRLAGRTVTPNPLFYREDGTPHPIGTLIKNPALATSLKTIAAEGARGFYEGELAAAIVDAVTKSDRKGMLSLEDLAGYVPKVREPVCATYRENNVCGFGPPSSGGITVLQTLKLLEGFPMSSFAPLSADAMHLLTQAERLAYADRDLYIADSDFVSVPAAGLLDEAYLRDRATKIALDADMGAAVAGVPPHAEARAADESPELPSTSHFVVADASGNVLSMTTSVENLFGSRLFVRGFFLNNQLTDFSFRPVDDDGKVIANALQPLKRPRSSMSPTIVLRDHKPVLAVGSPGGSRIIGYVAQTLVHVLDHGMNVKQAVEMPHVINRNGASEIEAHPTRGAEAEALAASLRARGHEAKLVDQNSGIHAVQIFADHLEGAADPRREGLAIGQ